MTAYVGIDGKARKVGAAYIGVDGVARKVVKAYVGVDGVAQLWWTAEEPNIPVVLQVEKRSFTSYAGETSYSSNCVLLDIYPKAANSVVNVTYGGLTKTLVFSGTNAQQVFFGAFNGETDSVTTPASGELTIEGGCAAFGHSTYQTSSKETLKQYCSCITGVEDWGSVEYIPDCAFYALQGSSKLELSKLPAGITRIGYRAFFYCSKITVTEIPHGVKTIDNEAFYMSSSVGDYNPNTKMEEITLPSTIESIGELAFSCTASGGDKAYLNKVTILATTPPVLEGTVHLAGSVVVPKGCGDAYKTAEGWSTYAYAIVEAS